MAEALRRDEQIGVGVNTGVNHMNRIHPRSSVLREDVKNLAIGCERRLDGDGASGELDRGGGQAINIENDNVADLIGHDVSPLAVS